ncbi:hypothetical protein BDV96DRAFT_566543 [Lophiotrema nucula]|uniref:Uncharacterized protein n=1 Tax=Lophiotrema nucula TaxID=690887 RepID=A0A6A5ZK97_9PLEO|nr:hypothetical protein BDV96DRAFT_566543 [Lophiotrema nucula]
MYFSTCLFLFEPLSASSSTFTSLTLFSVDPAIAHPTITKSAMSACIPIANALTERDTIAEEDRASYDEFHKHQLLQDDVYSGFYYDRTYVWFKVHNADTHQVIAEKKFKGSGKAMDYLLQGPGVNPEDLTLDGPVRKPIPSKVLSSLGDGE